jgi:hypothetical protein
MFLLAWTAAFVIYFALAAMAILGVLAALSWLLPAGKARAVCQVIAAIFGLAIATLMLWSK